MSTHYGYRCLTCNDFSPAWFNHGDTLLEKLHDNRWTYFSILRALELLGVDTYETEKSFYDYFEYYDTPSPLRFLRVHEGHFIQLTSEYRTDNYTKNLSTGDPPPVRDTFW